MGRTAICVSAAQLQVRVSSCPRCVCHQHWSGSTPFTRGVGGHITPHVHSTAHYTAPSPRPEARGAPTIRTCLHFLPSTSPTLLYPSNLERHRTPSCLSPASLGPTVLPLVIIVARAAIGGHPGSWCFLHHATGGLGSHVLLPSHCPWPPVKAKALLLRASAAALRTSAVPPDPRRARRTACCRRQ